uniref:CHCH domain-containing protein n=1 Tax=viral metagenome TaxID=1070528 RepID=A0A6C0LRT3_9ZZZZ
MPRNSKATYSFHPTTPTIFEKKNGFSTAAPVPAPPAALAPSFGQIVKEGFAFGVGSSIARTMIDSAFTRMGPSSAEPVRVPPVVLTNTDDIAKCNERALSNKCANMADTQRQAWVKCMKETKFDDSKCDDLF